MKEPCTCGTAFSFKKYCPSLVIAVKMLILVRNDAEAPYPNYSFFLWKTLC